MPEVTHQLVLQLAFTFPRRPNMIHKRLKTQALRWSFKCHRRRPSTSFNIYRFSSISPPVFAKLNHLGYPNRKGHQLWACEVSWPLPRWCLQGRSIRVKSSSTQYTFTTESLYTSINIYIYTCLYFWKSEKAQKINIFLSTHPNCMTHSWCI